MSASPPVTPHGSPPPTPPVDAGGGKARLLASINAKLAEYAGVAESIEYLVGRLRDMQDDLREIRDKLRTKRDGAPKRPSGGTLLDMWRYEKELERYYNETPPTLSQIHDEADQYRSAVADVLGDLARERGRGEVLLRDIKALYDRLPAEEQASAAALEQWRQAQEQAMGCLDDAKAAEQDLEDLKRAMQGRDPHSSLTHLNAILRRIDSVVGKIRPDRCDDRSLTRDFYEKTLRNRVTTAPVTEFGLDVD